MSRESANDGRQDSASIPVFSDEAAWLQGLKAGDQVHRFLGPVPMLLRVSQVTPNRIICGAWEFDRATGAEIDEELGWGGGGTGSFIRPVSH